MYGRLWARPWHRMRSIWAATPSAAWSHAGHAPCVQQHMCAVRAHNTLLALMVTLRLLWMVTLRLLWIRWVAAWVCVVRSAESEGVCGLRAQTGCRGAEAAICAVSRNHNHRLPEGGLTGGMSPQAAGCHFNGINPHRQGGRWRALHQQQECLIGAEAFALFAGCTSECGRALLAGCCQLGGGGSDGIGVGGISHS